VLPRLALVATSTALGLLLGEIALRVLGFEDELARRNTVYDARYGNVVGSPLFGQPVEAVPGRRLEIGARFRF